MRAEGIKNVGGKKSWQGNQEVKGLCTKLFPFAQIMHGAFHIQANVFTQNTDFWKKCDMLFLFLTSISFMPGLGGGFLCQINSNSTQSSPEFSAPDDYDIALEPQR